MKVQATALAVLACAAIQPAADAALYYAHAAKEPPTVSIATGSRNTDEPMIVASATDNVGVVGMDLYLNDVLRASSTVGTISFGWAGVEAGTYRIRITATDAARNVGAITAKIQVKR